MMVFISSLKVNNCVVAYIDCVKYLCTTEADLVRTEIKNYNLDRKGLIMFLLNVYREYQEFVNFQLVLSRLTRLNLKSLDDFAIYNIYKNVSNFKTLDNF